MVLELLEQYLVGGTVGFIIGIIVARIYFSSKIEMTNIGQVIEYAMIHKNITRLGSMTLLLNKLVADLKECSEEITDKLELSKDIEQELYEKQKKP